MMIEVAKMRQNTTEENTIEVNREPKLVFVINYNYKEKSLQLFYTTSVT